MKDRIAALLGLAVLFWALGSLVSTVPRLMAIVFWICGGATVMFALYLHVREKG